MIQAIYEELSRSQGSGRRQMPTRPGNDNTLQPKGAEG